MKLELKLYRDCQEYRGVLLPILLLDLHACMRKRYTAIKKVKSTYPDNLTLYLVLGDQHC